MTYDDENVLMDALLGFRLVSVKFSEFEQRFLKDNEERYETEGPVIRFSPKQWQIVVSIRMKVYGYQTR